MLGGLGAGLLVARHLPFLGTSQPTVFHDAGIVLLGGAMICAVGVVDDLIELDALTKLGGQVVAAGFLVLNGVQLWSLNLPGVGQFSLDPTPGDAALDPARGRHRERRQLRRRSRRAGRRGGADRRGGVLRVLPTSSPTPTARPSRSRRRCCARRMGGACAGFLPHNFFPARIFMGDSGSMLLGPGAVRLGADADRPVRQRHRSRRAGDDGSLAMLLPILLPISILVVPLADLVLAVVRRTRRGQAVLPARQGAPAPPAARVRAQPAPGGARDVAVGRADRVRGGADQPLLGPADLGRCSRLGAIVTVGADLPGAARPAPGRGPDRGASRPLTGSRFRASPDFVLLFTRPPHDDDPTRPPMTTTPSSSTRRSGRHRAADRRLGGTARCDSFARSGRVRTWPATVCPAGSPGGSPARGVFKKAIRPNGR